MKKGLENKKFKKLGTFFKRNNEMYAPYWSEQYPASTLLSISTLL